MSHSNCAVLSVSCTSQARLQRANTNLKLGHVNEALGDFELLSVSDKMFE